MVPVYVLVRFFKAVSLVWIISPTMLDSHFDIRWDIDLG